MFDRLILSEDLVDSRGRVLAARGAVVSPESIADAAQRAPALPRQPISETRLAADVEAPLADPVYKHLFPGDHVRDSVRRLMLAAPLPEALADELLALRRAGSHVHPHAFATAGIAVRMLLGVVGNARAVPELAAAALLHDLGMRYVPERILRDGERLAGDDALRIAMHPLLGAYHVASVLGPHPAVTAARVHHWRSGQGYPVLSEPPTRSMEVISVASAFAALTQPRPFRSTAYDARGASDVLVAEAGAGKADASTVRLLVHTLRGGRGDPRAIRFARDRTSRARSGDEYVHVGAPARSLV